MATDPANGMTLREDHKDHEPMPHDLNGSTYMIPQCPVLPGNDRERALCEALDSYETASGGRETREASVSIVRSALGMVYEDAPDIKSIRQSQFVKIYFYLVTGEVKGE